MPSLFKCENCDTKSWNQVPSSAGELLSRHVMRDGRYCPLCGYDLQSTSKTTELEGAQQGQYGAKCSETERADMEKVDRAQGALGDGDKVFARRILEEVIANSPRQYVYSFEQDGQFYIKCWDHAEFVSFCESVEAGHIPRRGNAVWLKSAYPRACYYLAFLDVEEGNFEVAQRNLEACLKLEPDQPLALCEMALICDGFKRPTEALSLYERALVARPYMSTGVRAKCLRGKGIQLIELNQLDGAEDALGESLTYEPDNPLAHKELKYIDYLRRGGESIGISTKPKRSDIREHPSEMQKSETTQPISNPELTKAEGDFAFMMQAFGKAIMDGDQEKVQAIGSKAQMKSLEIVILRLKRGESDGEIVRALSRAGLPEEAAFRAIQQVRQVAKELRGEGHDPSAAGGVKETRRRPWWRFWG